MKYRFKPTQGFWESFYALSPSQKDSTRRAWKIFKENPFDPRLRPHKIHRLSALYGRTIYAADVEADLRAVFYVERDTVVTVDIGSHEVYRG
jgi:mRNA-degrading endonuclease YafQ of YafQ-DinJ toxin-antitoxin module